MPAENGGMIAHCRPSLGEAEASAAAEAVAGGHPASGPRTAGFEAELGAATGRSRVVATVSGTAALYLVLRSLSPARKGVVIPSYTCVSVLHAVRSAGLDPIPVDVRDADGNIDPEGLEKVLEGDLAGRIGSAVVVHQFGHPAPFAAVEEMTRGREIFIIEDAAMGLGGTVGGRTIGSLGDASITSFYATKMIATGEGGAAATDDPDLAAGMRNASSIRGRTSDGPRINMRMGDIAASVGLVQIGRLDGFVDRRRRIAERYIEGITEMVGSVNETVEIPRPEEGSSWCRFVVRVPAGERDRIREELSSKGVSTGLGVLEPIHRVMGLRDEEFPVSSRWADSSISLPIYPDLTDDEVDRVLEGLRETIGG